MLPLPLGLRRVVELSTSVAGAAAGRWLGDFGAEVIAVERLSTVRDAALQMRNKLSCQIDPSTSEGRDLCLRLAASADIVLLDRDDETLRRAGIGYEALTGMREDTIVIEIGEGSARAGMGVIAASAALTALFHHRTTGRGQHVKVEFPLSRASMSALPILVAGTGNAEPATPDLPVSGVYVCAGGRVAVSVRSLQQLAGAGEAIGRPELADALSGGIEMRQALEQWTSSRSAVDAARALRACGVAAQELLSAAELRDNPQLRATGIFESVATGSEVQEVEGVRIGFSDTPAHVRLPPPLPGQQTRPILTGLLGIVEAEVERLARAGIIGGADEPAREA